MKTNFCLIIIFKIFLIHGLSSQAYEGDNSVTGKFLWPEGKKMAISLTFDDARLSQPDLGIPLLNKYNVKATFYVIPSNVLLRVDGWKMAVRTGHEIGNHSYTHPCTGNFTWSRNNALENYTSDEMNLQLDSANTFVRNLLGVHPVSFAYPCGQTFVGRGVETKSYIPVIASKFKSGRGWLDEGPNDPAFCDLAQLTGMEMDNKPFENIKQIIESAKANGSWLILAGHEMNREGSQTTLLETIEAICKYVKDPANGVWIGTVNEIAEYISNKRK